jgi:hypothetical protein
MSPLQVTSSSLHLAVPALSRERLEYLNRNSTRPTLTVLQKGLQRTASGLDLHPTSSRKIRDRQSGGTLAHIRTLTGNVVSVAFSWDAGLMEAMMANVRSRCAQGKDAPCCNYAG